MPKLYNSVTKQYMFMPDSYVGKFPFETVEVEGYKFPAIDADNDGLIQDGTPFERPVDTEMTVPQQKTAVKKASTKKSK